MALRAAEWRTTGLDEAWRGAVEAERIRAEVMSNMARSGAADACANRMKDPGRELGDSYAATRIAGLHDNSGPFAERS